MKRNENTKHLFTYGTLMVPEIMVRVAGVQLESEKATLEDAVRYSVINEEYPGVVRSPGERVEGVLYFDLPPDAIRRLDLFEGDYYSREEVVVHLGAEERSVVAMTYIFKESYRHLLSDRAWDYAYFLKKGRQAFEGEYTGYLEIE